MANTRSNPARDGEEADGGQPPADHFVDAADVADGANAADNQLPADSAAAAAALAAATMATNPERGATLTTLDPEMVTTIVSRVLASLTTTTPPSQPAPTSHVTGGSDRASGSNGLPRSFVKGPDKFDGGSEEDDIELFLEDIELFFSVCKVTDDSARFAALVLNLSGAARTWFRAHKNTITTYEALCNGLRDAFPRYNVENRARQALYSLHQKSSTRSFTTTFRKNLRLVGLTMSEEDQIANYIRGLKPEVQERVQNEYHLGNSRLKVLEQVIAYAEQVDQYLYDKKKASSFHPVRLSKTSLGKKRLNSIAVTSDGSVITGKTFATALANAAEAKRSRLSPAERQRRMDNDLCLYCGAEEHKLVDCPDLPSPSGKGRPRL